MYFPATNTDMNMTTGRSLGDYEALGGRIYTPDEQNTILFIVQGIPIIILSFLSFSLSYFSFPSIPPSIYLFIRFCFFFLFLSLILYYSPTATLPLSLSLHLFQSLSLSLSLSLSVFLSLCVSLSLSFSLSLSLSFCLSLTLSTSRSHSLSLILSLPLSQTVFFFHTVSSFKFFRWLVFDDCVRSSSSYLGLSHNNSFHFYSWRLLQLDN